MKTLFLIFMLMSILLKASGQDSINYKSSIIFNLTAKNELTIFEFHKSCRGSFYRKYNIQKKSNVYLLRTYKKIRGRERSFQKVFGKDCQLCNDSVIRENAYKKLRFVHFKNYILTDSNTIAFGKFEMLGIKSGLQPRTAGDSVSEFFFYINQKMIAHFSDNTSDLIDELNGLAIPRKYREEQQ